MTLPRQTITNVGARGADLSNLEKALQTFKGYSTLTRGLRLIVFWNLYEANKTKVTYAVDENVVLREIAAVEAALATSRKAQMAQMVEATESVDA